MWRRNYFLFRCLHLFAAGLHWSLIIVASCVCVCLSNLFALHNHIHLYCMTIETKQTRTLCNAACNTLSQCISMPLLVSRHWAFWGQIVSVSYCNQELVHCLVLAYCKSSWSSVLKRLVCSHSLTHTHALCLKSHSVPLHGHWAWMAYIVYCKTYLQHQVWYSKFTFWKLWGKQIQLLCLTKSMH